MSKQRKIELQFKPNQRDQKATGLRIQRRYQHHLLFGNHYQLPPVVGSSKSSEAPHPCHISVKVYFILSQTLCSEQNSIDTTSNYFVDAGLDANNFRGNWLGLCHDSPRKPRVNDSPSSHNRYALMQVYDSIGLRGHHTHDLF